MMPVRHLPVFLIPLLLCGCGNPGSPLPPSLMLPQPVVNLGAGRTGDAVTLHWTMPRRTTDNVLLRGDQRAVLCRAAVAGPCEMMGELLLEAGKPAQFTDNLPPALRQGQPALLRYEVRLQNRRRRDAGASNAAFAFGGYAPPAIRYAQADATAKGIAVRWQVAPENLAEKPAFEAYLLVRIERDRVLRLEESDKPGKQETQAGVPQPMRQLLETREHPPASRGGSWSPDFTLDADAAMNRSYRYTVQLVEQVRLGGHVLEVSGAPAQTGVVEARDVFPPGAPADVAAVADADGGAIDLSWTADAEPDVAGYMVFRRVEEARAAPVLVSGDAPLATPNWSDTAAEKGMRYAYSVVAVDTSGNKSARSAEVIEMLPVKSQ